MDDLRDRFEQASVRIERMIFIPAATVAGGMSEELREMVQDDLVGVNVDQILAALPRMKDLIEADESPDEDWIDEVLGPVDGYFAQLAKPVPQDFYKDDKDSFGFSWWLYQTRWVYGLTMDDIATAAEAFAEQVVDTAYARHLAEKASAA